MSTTATGVLAYDSILNRQAWIKDGIVKARDKSFWAFAESTDRDAIIRQKQLNTATEGLQIVFDYSGALESFGVKNKETAIGKGEDKKRFSDHVTVDMWRFPVKNGVEFDLAASADLNSFAHNDSKRLLSEVWHKVKDQTIFDVFQHTATDRFLVKRPGLTYEDLQALSLAVSTGVGLTEMGSKNPRPKRFPTQGYRMQDGKEYYLLVLDPYAVTTLFMDSKFRDTLSQADVRGDNNRVFTGVIGKILNFIIMTPDSFVGISQDQTKPGIRGGFVDSRGYGQFNSTKIIRPGLRTYRGDNDAFVPKSWEGDRIQSGDKVFSRGLVIGRRALHFGVGKDPDYNLEWSPDHKITSESCLITWCGVKPVKLLAEANDYEAAEAAGSTLGFLAVDLQLPDSIGDAIKAAQN